MKKTLDMRTVFFIVLLSLLSMALALNKPSNYFAASGTVRGNQQQVVDFAVWNVRRKKKDSSVHKNIIFSDFSHYI